MNVALERLKPIARGNRHKRLLGSMFLAALITTGAVIPFSRFVSGEEMSVEPTPVATPTKPVIKPFYTNDPKHCAVDLGPQMFRPHCATPTLEIRQSELTGKYSKANSYESWGLSDPEQSVSKQIETQKEKTSVPVATINPPLSASTPPLNDCNRFSADDIQHELCWRTQGK